MQGFCPLRIKITQFLDGFCFKDFRYDLKVLFFNERGKPEYQEKNLSEQGREPTTILTCVATGSPSSIWEYCSCVIFKKAIIKRICVGIQVINTRMNFQENTLYLVYLCLLASCVVIIPIRCDFSDFLLSRNLLNRYGSGNNHKNKHKNIIQ